MQTLLCAAMAGLLASSQAAPGPLVVGLENAATWLGRSDSRTEVTLPLRFRAKVRPSALIVGQDHPNSTRFLALFDRVAVPLPVDFGAETGSLAFDEYGDLKDGYRIQVGEHDFNRDGQPEILVAVGDGLVDLAVNVIHYTPPKNPSDAARAANWKLIGRFSGQQNAIVKSNKIQLPYGSKGLFLEYTWVNRGYFLRTN